MTLDGRRQAARGGQAARRDRALEGLRHPARRPQRLAAARRAPPGGSAYWLVDLDSTNGSSVNGQRTDAGEARATATRSRSARPSYASSGGLRGVTVVGSLAVGEALLILEDPLPRAPLPLHLADRADGEPRPAAAAGELRARARARPRGCSAAPQPPTGRLVVVSSPDAPKASATSSTPRRSRRPRRRRTTSPLERRLRLGAPRAPRAAARRRLGLGPGSTNGTYVNGAKRREAAAAAAPAT